MVYLYCIYVMVYLHCIYVMYFQFHFHYDLSFYHECRHTRGFLLIFLEYVLLFLDDNVDEEYE